MIDNSLFLLLNDLRIFSSHKLHCLSELSRIIEDLDLTLAIGVGVVVYAILLYFMRIPEFDRTLGNGEREDRSENWGG